MDPDARKARAEMLRGREVRRLTSAALETRSEGDTITLTGYASTTEKPYDMGYYQETIKRGAFTTTLSQAPDVPLLLNHEGIPMARTANGSLFVHEDKKGLGWAAQLDASDPDAQRIARKVDSGLLTECSFAFRATRQSWDEEYENREITEVDINRGDVSIVTFGANPTTSVALRSAFADLAELSDDELLAMREDPAVLTVMRRLVPSIPLATVSIPDLNTEAAGTVDHKDGPNLEAYRARALALRLRQQ